MLHRAWKHFIAATRQRAPGSTGTGPGLWLAPLGQGLAAQTLTEVLATGAVALRARSLRQGRGALRQLGSSSLQVTEACLGTMTWGVQNSEEEAHAQLDYAIKEPLGGLSAHF